MLPLVDIPVPRKPKYLHDGKKLIPDEYVKKTRRIFSREGGTRLFDDFHELNDKLSAHTIQDYRIHSIKLLITKSDFSTILLGIQVCYKNISNWSIVNTSLKCGNCTSALDSEEIFFSDGEFIRDAEVYTSTQINSLTFSTSRNKMFTQGVKEGLSKSFSIEEGNAIIGIYGSTGASLSSIGFYTASLKEVRYWRKRPYILMKAWLTRNNELQEDMVKFGQNEKFWAGAAFVMLVGKGDQIFAQVMKFV